MRRPGRRDRGGAVRALIVRMGNPALAIPDHRAHRRCARQPRRARRHRRPPDARRPMSPPTCCPSPTTSSAPTCVTGYLQATPFLRCAPAVVEPLGERRPQWWVFAELSRRLGLPLFGSARPRRRAAPGRARRRGDRRVDGRPRPAPVAPRCAPRRTGSATSRWRRDGWCPAPSPNSSTSPRPSWSPSSPGLGSRSVARGDGLVLVNRRTHGQYNSLAVRPAPEPEVARPPRRRRHPWPARRRPRRPRRQRRVRATCPSSR